MSLKDLKLLNQTLVQRRFPGVVRLFYLRIREFFPRTFANNPLYQDVYEVQQLGNHFREVRPTALGYLSLLILLLVFDLYGQTYVDA